MLHIIFIILKIIGILLLVILGIILFILLLILFAPFRYSIDGEKGEEICFHARVTWVLFFLRVACSYEKKKLVYYVKVFGYPLVGNEAKKKKAKKKTTKNKKRKKKEKSLSEEEKLLLSEIEEEAKLQAVELEQLEEKKKRSKEVTKDRKTKEEKSVYSEQELTKAKEQRKPDAEKEISKSEQKETVSKLFKKRWRNPIHIIRNILCKIKDTVCGILEKIRQFVYKLDEVKKKIDELLEKAREWMEFMNEEMTKKSLSKLMKIIKKLLKHILPRKVKGNLAFGLEEPAMMGQVLAVLGMAMPIYKDNLKIQPCFGVNMIQGDIKVKGKIRLGYLLYLAVLILIDKGIMGTIKKTKVMAKGEKESKGGE